MTFDKFGDEYRKAVDGAALPCDYKEKILSRIECDENSAAKASVRPLGLNRRVLSYVVAAVLVAAVGLGAVFSFGLNLLPQRQVRFYVASATSLKSVAGARIVFIDSDGDFLTDKRGNRVTAVTDENGEAVATIPATEEYVAQITVEGYIPAYGDCSGGNCYISPVMNEDTYRAVLTWQSECDLDAHLSVTFPDGSEKKLSYFKSDIVDAEGEVIAALDTDNEKGDGPETITFNVQEDMRVRFSVASYSALRENSHTQLALTDAEVTLYRGDECVGVYSIDTASEGNVWRVFEIENSQLTFCDYTYSVSAVTEIE